MSSRSITVQTLDTNQETMKVEVSVSFQQGGLNYFNYKTEPKGYYFSVTPVEHKGNGIRSFVLGSGVKVLMESAKRFSQKRLCELSQTVTQHERYQAVLDRICQEHRLLLVKAA